MNCNLLVYAVLGRAFLIVRIDEHILVCLVYNGYSTKTVPLHSKQVRQSYSCTTRVSALEVRGGQSHASPALPPGKKSGTLCTGGWVDLRAGLEVGRSHPTRVRTPDRLGRNKSLYRQRCPGRLIIRVDEQLINKHT